MPSRRRPYRCAPTGRWWERSSSPTRAAACSTPRTSGYSPPWGPTRRSRSPTPASSRWCGTRRSSGRQRSTRCTRGSQWWTRAVGCCAPTARSRRCSTGRWRPSWARSCSLRSWARPRRPPTCSPPPAAEGRRPRRSRAPTARAAPGASTRPGARACVSLNDLGQRTLLLMSEDLKLNDNRTEKNLGSGMPDVVGDRHALQQVVLNLVTNAAHALAGNEAGRPRTIRISTWFDERVRLRVADTGPGIPEEVLPHLFTPFFTTKEPGHGTGLGLSITYSIVEAHGGQITVQQPAEGGAAFLVELPPAGADVPQRHSAEVEAPPLPPAARRTILLVDDDPAVRRMIKALFGREGHTVEVARNPGQALDLARTRTYDLILADGQASARGRRFVEELVEARPDLRDRILVATGDVRPTTEVALGQLGLRYVRKPFNLRDLRDEAARVWAAAALS